MQEKYRLERDSMGELKVPKDALYGAQTQRAIDNFPISHRSLPKAFIHALALIKMSAAKANAELKLLDAKTAQAIVEACEAIRRGDHDKHFPVDVFQTGSGTSTNMNLNEVIAKLSSKILGSIVHPNDLVNMSQSSNDVIPSAIHLSALITCQQNLLPQLEQLAICLENKSSIFQDIIKTGRTHLMDAMPLSLGQEIGGWAKQMRSNYIRISQCMPKLEKLALGGTAVGTGINAHPNFAHLACNFINQTLSLKVSPADNYFESMSSQDTAVELSGQLKVLACGISKICNDLRWMNSGPLSGLSEIELPAIQPGSSIMPGKVNPVIPEALCMVAAEVLGNDLSITIAGQSGNFQLNTMLPLVADKLLTSIELLANGMQVLKDKALQNIKPNQIHLAARLNANPILVTALNAVIGYELGAKIAKTAYAENKPIIEVAMVMTQLSKAELIKLLDPKKLIQGGLSN